MGSGLTRNFFYLDEGSCQVEGRALVPVQDGWGTGTENQSIIGPVRLRKGWLIPFFLQQFMTLILFPSPGATFPPVSLEIQVFRGPRDGEVTVFRPQCLSHMKLLKLFSFIYSLWEEFVSLQMSILEADSLITAKVILLITSITRMLRKLSGTRQFLLGYIISLSCFSRFTSLFNYL